MAGKTDLHFITNVQLKSIIGKDLINDENIAILELVKNSFDADAKKVIVRYLNLKDNDDTTVSTFSNKTTRLIIQDDGLGMDLNDIQHKWLNIAYSEKKLKTRQHKRMMAGAKGVGRFSCDRLGQFLNLYAKKKLDNHYVKLTINWREFEIQDEKLEIQSIPLKWEYVSKQELINSGIEPFTQGVTLEIIKLRSTWAYPKRDEKNEVKKWDIWKLIELKKYLEKLINPNQAFEENDFGIFMDAPEFIEENKQLNIHDQFIGQVENRIFDKLDFKSTSIEAYTINYGQKMRTELKDKGKTIFWITENNPYYPYVKDAKVSLYYLNPYAKAFFTKQTGIQSVNYGSIFLFINGFRIPPYGEVGNDWLGLDQRKGQGTQRYIGLREIVGQIEILDENNNFQIISSREGIVKNENYFKLTKQVNNDSFFYKTLRRIERYVVEGLAWDSSIYDPKDPRFKEIERKIIEGKTSEEELEYRDTDEIKRGRVYTAIHSIISAKAQDVDELYINEHLILDKIEEDQKNSEQELKQLLADFEEKKIDSDIITRILENKINKNRELDKQIKEFTKYSTSTVTSKAVLELQNYKSRIEEQQKIVTQLQQRLNTLKSEKEIAENSAIAHELARKQAEAKLKIEIDKNTYLNATRKTLSSDAEDLIHSIKVSALGIDAGIEKVLRRIKESYPNERKIIEDISNIKFITDKVLKLSRLITKSNFKADQEVKKVNVAKYIREYIETYSFAYTDKIRIKIEGESKYISRISLLDLSIVIDNLISNSYKANATKILIEISDNGPELIILFHDNGNGVSEELLMNPSSMFDLGVKTNIEGSGIGLFTVAKKMKEMYGKVEYVGNNLKLTGATFKLAFN